MSISRLYLNPDGTAFWSIILNRSNCVFRDFIKGTEAQAEKAQAFLSTSLAQLEEDLQKMQKEFHKENGFL
jgi:hypothetical protein